MQNTLANHEQNEIVVIDTPVGRLKLIIENDGLKQVDLDSKAGLTQPDSPFGELIYQQLLAYFNSANHQFKVPFVIQGTDYQRKIWYALCQIPPGTVKTYGQLAKELSSSARAVGNACRKNPTPIIVPCHRVVAASGLGGFAGQTEGNLLNIKRKLLIHEGCEF